MATSTNVPNAPNVDLLLRQLTLHQAGLSIIPFLAITTEYPTWRAKYVGYLISLGAWGPVVCNPRNLTHKVQSWKLSQTQMCQDKVAHGLIYATVSPDILKAAGILTMETTATGNTAQEPWEKLELYCS